MSISTTLPYILTALQGPFNQTGVTDDLFRNEILPNDTFTQLTPPLDLSSLCSNFTAQLDQQIYDNFNSCIAIADNTYDLRSGDVINGTLSHNLGIVGINGTSESAALADSVMAGASGAILFFCNVTHCNKDEAEEGVGQCTFATLFPNYGNGTADTRRRMSEYYRTVCRERICDQVAARVSNDPDIGGIGVFISYFQQVLIVLMMLANVVAHNLPFKPKGPGSLTRKRSFFSSSRWHKSSEEFIRFGFNFHKSQVWFLSVLMIASYIRRATEDVSIVNSYMLLSIALNGVVLLSFTLLMLALLRRDMVDCFVMYMTGLSYLLCLAFMIYVMSTGGSETENWLHAATFCDGRVVPMLVPQERWDAITTYIDRSRSIKAAYYVVVMVFCTVVLFFTSSLVRLRYNVKKYYNGHKLVVISVGGFTLAAYVLIFFMQIWLMALFIRLASAIWQNQWGFGQIVAVTVWVPVVADYFWDRFQKEKDRLRHLEPPSWASRLGVVQYLHTPRQSMASGFNDKKVEEGKVEEKESGPDDNGAER